MSTGGPSRDDPPLETSSPKVKPSRNPSEPPALGPDPAKVEVIVFLDYTEPKNARMRRAMRQIANEFPGDVRVEIRQIPAFGIPESEPATLAALAAHLQGKFWPMNDCLLSHQASLSDPVFKDCAAEAKLDAKRFDKDRTSAALRKRMEAERELIRRFGVWHAPAFTVNGRLFVGEASWEQVRGSVDEERRQVDALLEGGKKLPEALRLRAANNVPPKSPNALTAYTALIRNQPPGTAKKKS